jgi:hypothetical protein
MHFMKGSVELQVQAPAGVLLVGLVILAVLPQQQGLTYCLYTVMLAAGHGCAALEPVCRASS